MRARMVFLVTPLIYGLSFSVACQAAQDDEEVHIASSSSSFSEGFPSAVQSLLQRGFQKGLKAPKLGAAYDKEFQRTIEGIKARTPISGVADSVEGGSYDVVLQPGHYLRTYGRTGATGSRVTERDFVAYLVGPIADKLRAKGLSVLVLKADPMIRGPITSRIFLAVHAEGADPSCQAKPSLGYSSGTSPMAMHAVGWALVQALGLNYQDFQKDNFTANESHYYMFSRITSTLMQGVLEVGEITCAATEEEMIGSASAISNNIARAIVFIHGQ